MWSAVRAGKDARRGWEGKTMTAQGREPTAGEKTTLQSGLMKCGLLTP